MHNELLLLLLFKPFYKYKDSLYFRIFNLLYITLGADLIYN